MNLKLLASKIKRCRLCALGRTRKHAVPGEGSSKAKIMFIGEAPGAEEDRTGRPFMGRAGEFVNELLKKNKINRKKCFITSVVKCHPPRNRNPKAIEARICVQEFLAKQIMLVNPKIIVLLGNIARRYVPKELLKGRKVIATHHPAAGMRFPKSRRKMERDFKRI
jgi:uracil-DNA glycosylase family 4